MRLGPEERQGSSTFLRGRKMMAWVSAGYLGAHSVLIPLCHAHIPVEVPHAEVIKGDLVPVLSVVVQQFVGVVANPAFPRRFPFLLAGPGRRGGGRQRHLLVRRGAAYSEVLFLSADADALLVLLFELKVVLLLLVRELPPRLILEDAERQAHFLALFLANLSIGLLKLAPLPQEVEVDCLSWSPGFPLGAFRRRPREPDGGCGRGEQCVQLVPHSVAAIRGGLGGDSRQSLHVARRALHDVRRRRVHICRLLVGEPFEEAAEISPIVFVGHVLAIAMLQSLCHNPRPLLGAVLLLVVEMQPRRSRDPGPLLLQGRLHQSLILRKADRPQGVESFAVVAGAKRHCRGLDDLVLGLRLPRFVRGLIDKIALRARAQVSLQDVPEPQKALPAERLQRVAFHVLDDGVEGGLVPKFCDNTFEGALLLFQGVQELRWLNRGREAPEEAVVHRRPD
eukprot:scaffold613_cov243-Pinguiococcus_pyrenoidosus.AAC.18